MRDFTGLDSLISPLFCLLVTVTVWAIERCLPGRDILFFIPKSWRESQPLYQLTDDQAFKDTAADMALPAVPASHGVVGWDSPIAFPAGKDPSVAPAGIDTEDSFDAGSFKKGATAAAGMRPGQTDDSAHGGQQMRGML